MLSGGWGSLPLFEKQNTSGFEGEQVSLLSANSPGNVDAAKNDDVCTEINISVTTVICYPNHAEPQLTRTSVTQVCWQMAAV